MRLWWVRHGPTHEKAFCGWRAVPADHALMQAAAGIGVGFGSTEA